MDTVRTNCPECRRPLEFPRDFANVICAGCGSAYHVRDYKGAIGLSLIEQKGEPPGPDPASEEMTLAELEELIAETGSQIEAIKSREQSGPLSAGCAFFSLFLFVIFILAAFATVGRDYFGGWLFYLSIVAVVVAGLFRIRRRLLSQAMLDQLREERARLEEALALLESERDRARRLRPSGPQPRENGGAPPA